MTSSSYQLILLCFACTLWNTRILLQVAWNSSLQWKLYFNVRSPLFFFLWRKNELSVLAIKSWALLCTALTPMLVGSLSPWGIVFMGGQDSLFLQILSQPGWLPALTGLSPGQWQQIALGVWILQNDWSPILLSLNTSWQRRCDFHEVVRMTF